MKYRILAFTLPLMWAANASAQNIDKCVTLSDASARLACFDAAHKTPSAIRFPQESKPQITAPQSNVIKNTVQTPKAITPAAPPVPKLTAEEKFGKSRNLLETAKPKADKTLKTISSKIQSAQFTNTGKVRVTLENGQIWQQAPSDSTKIIGSRLRRQTSVVIKRAALGSFSMKIEPWGRSMKARRIK